MATLISDYPVASVSSAYTGGGDTGSFPNDSAFAMAFTCNANATLDSMEFNIYAYTGANAPTGGVMYAYLFDITGTVGSSAVPTGSALATSSSVNIISIPSSPSTNLVTFSFTGANRVQLTNGNNYAAVVWTGDYNAGAYATAVGKGTVTPPSTTNLSIYSDGTGWVATGYSGNYICYYVYGVLPPTLTGVSSMTGVQSITF